MTTLLGITSKLNINVRCHPSILSTCSGVKSNLNGTAINGLVFSLGFLVVSSNCTKT